MPVVLVGLNHITAPVELRERLYFGIAKLPKFLPELVALPDIDEAVVLSTCNRTEIVISGQNSDALIEQLACNAHLPIEELLPHLYLLEDREAITHLFRVACGLDSLVIGETQILRQIRDALDAASVAGTAGRILTGIFQQAIATGKRARTETAISQGAFSVGRAGVELARSLFPNLNESPVLILGAGKISELTAMHLAESGVNTIFVANRTHAHAEELAGRLGGRAIHYEAIAQALAQVDILLSSTSAPHYVLHVPEVQRALEIRGQRPLCLIDLAVPRDIDPAVAELPNVHLYNVDDLRGITESDAERRSEEVPKVEAIIASEVERWAQRQAGLDVSTVIVALRDSFDRVRRDELARSTQLLAGLSPEQQAAVEAMTSSMINKLLHTPTVRLKEILAERPESSPQSMLGDLFALQPHATGEPSSHE